MKLYEINQDIEALFYEAVDAETGEILMDEDEFHERLNALDMARIEILEYLAKKLFNARADIEATDTELRRLSNRKKSLKSEETRLLDILDRECAGQKTDLGIAKVNYRKVTNTNITDAQVAVNWLLENYPDAVKLIEPEIKKDEAKKLIKQGIDIPGVELADRMSCSIK